MDRLDLASIVAVALAVAAPALARKRSLGRVARLPDALPVQAIGFTRSGWRGIASCRESTEMKRSDHVDRWLHGEENRANQESQSAALAVDAKKKNALPMTKHSAAPKSTAVRTTWYRQ